MPLVRDRAWTVGAARILVVLAGISAGVIFLVKSLDRDAYHYYRFEDRSDWQWPVLGVIFVLGFTVIETLAVYYYVFTPKGGWRIWQRAIRLTAILMAWTFILLTGVMHSPGFYMLHIIWLYFLILFLMVAATTSAGVHLWDTVRARRNPTAGSV